METSLDWLVKPVTQRGEAVVELVTVGSLFPFGFLKKNIGLALRESVLVWPAQISYQWTGASAVHSGSQGQRTARAGRGDDLLALRNYAQGDSHRLIHWKASARLGHLMIRQFAAESHDGYMLRLDTPAAVWSRPEQFELLCSFVATMAEDLFAGARRFAGDFDCMALRCWKRGGCATWSALLDRAGCSCSRRRWIHTCG